MMLKLLNLNYQILSKTIVRNFSLTLSAGQVITLFGPSGCGKTTILRLISGLEEPKKGKILNSFKKTAYLFQENRLLENLTAFENIRLFSGASSDEIYSHLALVGLDMVLRKILAGLLATKLAKKQLACVLVTHERQEAAMLSNEILLLSKKHMNIEQKVRFELAQSERDECWVAGVLAGEFGGEIYYD